MLQALKLTHLETVLHDERSHHSEGCTQQQRVALACRNERKQAHSNKDPVKLKKNTNMNFSSTGPNVFTPPLPSSTTLTFGEKRETWNLR